MAGQMPEIVRRFRDPSRHSFLLGPRGTGKSTWLRGCYRGALFVDLLLPGWQRRLAAHPKFFYFDVVVYRALRPAGPLDWPEEIGGAALEGLVAQHLRAWIDYGSRDTSLYYWRTRAGSEVDFAVYGAGGFWALEVKHAARVRRSDLRSLVAFGADHPEARLAFLYRGRERIEIEGIPCLLCGDFLAHLVPGEPLF
jgi:predicted AAA+ superfamily ATPase